MIILLDYKVYQVGQFCNHMQPYANLYHQLTQLIFSNDSIIVYALKYQHLVKKTSKVIGVQNSNASSVQRFI